MRKVHSLSLIFIDFYVPAIRSHLNSTETSLQFSEDRTLCGLSHKYRRHQQRDLDRHQVFGAYHLYILYNVYDRTEPGGTPLLYTLEQIFQLRSKL
jgi:hypothetical protein